MLATMAWAWALFGVCRMISSMACWRLYRASLRCLARALSRACSRASWAWVACSEELAASCLARSSTCISRSDHAVWAVSGSPGWFTSDVCRASSSWPFTPAAPRATRKAGAGACVAATRAMLAPAPWPSTPTRIGSMPEWVRRNSSADWASATSSVLEVAAGRAADRPRPRLSKLSTARPWRVR